MKAKTLCKLPEFIFKPVARWLAKLHKTELGKYQIRIAQTTDEYRDAFSLVHHAYVCQGIESVRSDPLRMTPQHTLPEATVLVAYEGDNLVGTMTVTADSPAGLPLDKDYGLQLDVLRAQGKQLAEYGSLAVVERCWHTGVTTLLNAAANFWVSKVLGVSHVVVGVNPSAAPWYRALFAFRQMGKAKAHAELSAPVVGLVQDLEEVLAYFRKHFTRRMSHGVPVCEAFDQLILPGVTLPRSLELCQQVRWKMSRQVFQELFGDEHARLERLDLKTRAYLEEWRTPETLIYREAV